MPKIPEMGSVWSAWSDALQLIVTQEQDPVAAMHDAVIQIKSLLKCE
jgi:arabinogalactan oligomer/maltooligosaccharide transport system substrate-binding protein